MIIKNKKNEVKSKTFYSKKSFNISLHDLFLRLLNINKNCIVRNVKNRLQSRNEGIVIECRVNEQEKK